MCRFLCESSKRFSGSQTTTSASAPTAIVPFFADRGRRSWPARSTVISTKRFSEMRSVAHAVVQQVQARLDARHAVRDLGEVAAPELLLALHAERAVIGRDHLEVVVAQAAPQVLVVVLGAQRRRADVLGALELVAAACRADRPPRGTGTAGRSRRRPAGRDRAPPSPARARAAPRGARCRPAPWPSRRARCARSVPVASATSGRVSAW